MTRTQKEIVDYYDERKANDMLGFLAEVLLPRLIFQHAQPFLNASASAEKWKLAAQDTASVRVEMAMYMAFAWEKALDHRGISATRSIQKMQAFMFLLGDDELAAVCEENDGYTPYGAPILARICRKYELPIPTDERAQRMARGERCERSCAECFS